MNTIELGSAVVEALGGKPPLPSETLRSWVNLAAHHGFNAILPLVEKEDSDVFKRTLMRGAADWLFMVDVGSWGTALLIGPDLGAAVEALKSFFTRVVVVEPNEWTHRLLEIRFANDIVAGHIEIKKTLDERDVDLDLIWLIPALGRSAANVRLTAELTALLRDCTRRLAPGGLLALRAIRDRGVLKGVPLPGIRLEPDHGYTLRDVEGIFRSPSGVTDHVLTWYWLTSHNSTGTCGVALTCEKAIAYSIGAGSKWFRFVGPLGRLGVMFVTHRVSSLMLTVRKTPVLRQGRRSTCTELKKKRDGCVLDRIIRVVREDIVDLRGFVPLLYRSGSRRAAGHAKYLLLDVATSKPAYIARISNGPEGEKNIRDEHNIYCSLRRTNRALQSLSPIHYVISDDGTDSKSTDPQRAPCKDGLRSFSIDRFFERSRGTGFRHSACSDISSMNWLNWFQKESASMADAKFTNELLCSDLSILMEQILRSGSTANAIGVTGKGLATRLPVDVVKPMFDELMSRCLNLDAFCIPFTAVHGDFCQVNLIAYEKTNEGDCAGLRVVAPGQEGRSACRACEQTRIHVFDWEYLDIGVPLFDPWLYALGHMYAELRGQANRETIKRCLTGISKVSQRIEGCVSHYAAISALPGDLIAAYLPVAILLCYARELASAIGYVGRVHLLEQTILVLALYRREVWHYLDALTDKMREVEDRNGGFAT